MSQGTAIHEARLQVLHGPNLNLLGTRETSIYGSTTLEEIDRELSERAHAAGFSLDCVQSNYEGVLIDHIHAAAASGARGLLFNFGALTHTSLALADALRSVDLPAVEVHLSNVHAREPIRHTTLTGAAAIGVIAGFGPASYTLGLRALIDYLNDAPA